MLFRTKRKRCKKISFNITEEQYIFLLTLTNKYGCNMSDILDQALDVYEKRYQLALKRQKNINKNKNKD